MEELLWPTGIEDTSLSSLPPQTLTPEAPHFAASRNGAAPGGDSRKEGWIRGCRGTPEWSARSWK